MAQLIQFEVAKGELKKIARRQAWNELRDILENADAGDIDPTCPCESCREFFAGLNHPLEGRRGVIVISNHELLTEFLQALVRGEI